MEQLFDRIGYQGPFLLAGMTLFSIRNHTKFLLVYPIAWIANVYLNKWLKGVLQEPRPLADASDYSGVEIYGMPSGHAQSIFFSMVYLVLVTRSTFLFVLSLFFVVMTLVQRWYFGHHSPLQLLAGAVIGSLFAVLCVRWVQRTTDR
jgi:membrane-associated phospholipid phosphatase